LVVPAHARNLTTIAVTCVMAILLCLVQTASAVATRSLEKTASGNFFADPNTYTGQIAPETQQPHWEIAPAATPTASGRQVWLSADPIGERGGVNLYGYVKNSPIRSIDQLGLFDLQAFGAAFDYSIGAGVEAGIKKCKFGPIDFTGPSVGWSWKTKGDLAGGFGSSIDLSANLFAAKYGNYKVGLGWANESGIYTPNGGALQAIDKTQKVCGFKRDTSKWSSKSPWTVGIEIGAIVNIGGSIDFKQLWDSLWK
jgi:hypothetical protein